MAVTNCPRCGALTNERERLALSRRCSVDICNRCGQAEAMLDASRRMPGAMEALGFAPDTVVACERNLERYCEENGLVFRRSPADPKGE